MWENVGFYRGCETFACKVKVVVLFDLAQKHKSYLRYICHVKSHLHLPSLNTSDIGHLVYFVTPLWNQNFRISSKLFFLLDLKETIEQTNELNEVDDDGSVQGSRGLQSGSGDSIFGTDHEDKVRMQLPLDWVEERFRVDRRKLEEMILGEYSVLFFLVCCELL